MHVAESKSGLLIATDKPPEPPEHPVRAVIRKHLAALKSDLDQFEQTTHGHFGSGCIQDVSNTLADAYRNPRAFTISSLSQAIDRLK